MRMLVTGGAGFIGSHVVDAYVAAGHEVLVVDTFATGDPNNVNRAAECRHVDIRGPELEAVFAAFRPEVVNHHAAQASVPISVNDPVADASINVLGTINLLQLSARYGARKFIFASTGGAIYGDPAEVPCTEDAPPLPLSPYAAAKAAAEVYVAMFHRTYELDFTILRYGNVYGPRMHFRAQEGLLVAIFASKMLRSEPVTIDWNGEQSRDFVYVEDCAAANVAALEHGSGGVYNIGTGLGTTVNRIFELLAAITNYRLEPGRGPKRQGDVFRIYLDASRAARDLGWRPTVALEEGLRRTADFFRSRP
ncbi:MAG: NAD-dependent epimerase/dehydratase family protein [Chloroflexi bacterium]|nr:NAD-dependent epimerase/dehydratase family protein [Chloroflexota bacterium]